MTPEVAAAVRRNVDQAPPLTPQQRDLIAALLGPRTARDAAPPAKAA